MKATRLIAVSVGVNVILAGAIILSASRRANSTAVRPSATNSSRFARPVAVPPLPVTPDTRHFPQSPFVASEEFRWSQLESADYRVFVRNLRAVGCPEATVRDIIVPDVNELFYQRVKELVDKVQNRFWDLLADQKAFEKMVDEKHTELNDLDTERDNVLVELLGRGANHRMQKDQLAQAGQIEQRKQFLDFLPADKIERCLAVDAKFETLRGELNNADTPLDSTELSSRSKKLREQQKSEFEALLTPDELAEYQLRNSRFANLRFQLNGFDATEAEVKAMARTQESVAALPQANGQQQQRDALKSLLGVKRFAEYERTLDNRFQEFYQVADRYDLPAQKAAEAYEIRKAAEDTAQKVRRDKDVTEDDRNDQLAATRVETERALTEALGKDAFKTYETRSGQWLSQLGRAKE